MVSSFTAQGCHQSTIRFFAYENQAGTQSTFDSEQLSKLEQICKILSEPQRSFVLLFHQLCNMKPGHNFENKMACLNLLASWHRPMLNLSMNATKGFLHASLQIRHNGRLQLFSVFRHCCFLFFFINFCKVILLGICNQKMAVDIIEKSFEPNHF